jgi:hypothetical protein
LTINAQRPQAESVQRSFFPPSNRWSLRPDPNPSPSTFSSFNPQMANQDQALQVKYYPPQAHPVLPFSNLISNFSFALSCSW